MRLLLLRHAKSSWDDPALPDKDRPLAPRGTRASAAMGAWMADTGYIPDLVLCSSALRTRETLAGVLPALLPHMRGEPEIRLRESLYGVAGGDYRHVVATEGGTAPTLLVIGHNPATEATAQALIGGGDEKTIARLVGKYPTAALAVLDFDLVNWGDIAPKSGYLHAFIKPGDIES